MPAMPHIAFSARSDAADALLWNHPTGPNLHARQCGPNPLQALLVAPLLYAREARLALTATQIVVLDQAPESLCEAVDIPGRRRVAVDTVLDQVRNASHLTGDNDGK